MNKIRKGDEVVVITGRDKGRRGTVIKVLDTDGTSSVVCVIDRAGPPDHAGWREQSQREFRRGANGISSRTGAFSRPR